LLRSFTSYTYLQWDKLRNNKSHTVLRTNAHGSRCATTLKRNAAFAINACQEIEPFKGSAGGTSHRAPALPLLTHFIKVVAGCCSIRNKDVASYSQINSAKEDLRWRETEMTYG
jgi:hypothetical protein